MIYMPKGFSLIKEMVVRFLLGGTAVVLCYVISVYSPVKFIGGVFAAFPAVMGAAIVMTGCREGSQSAAAVARGAVSGMIGCTVSVLSALYLIRALGSWPLGLVGAVMVWLVTSIAANLLIPVKSGNSYKSSRS